MQQSCTELYKRVGVWGAVLILVGICGLKYLPVDALALTNSFI